MTCCSCDAMLPPSQMERYVDNRWQKVAPADRLKLGQHDAQVRSATCMVDICSLALGKLSVLTQQAFAVGSLIPPPGRGRDRLQVPAGMQWLRPGKHTPAAR